MHIQKHTASTKTTKKKTKIKLEVASKIETLWFEWICRWIFHQCFWPKTVWWAGMKYANFAEILASIDNVFDSIHTCQTNACGYCVSHPFICSTRLFHMAVHPYVNVILSDFDFISSDLLPHPTLCQLQMRWINPVPIHGKIATPKTVSMPLVPIKQYKCFRRNHGWWHLCCGFIKKHIPFFFIVNATGKNYKYIYIF